MWIHSIQTPITRRTRRRFPQCLNRMVGVHSCQHRIAFLFLEQANNVENPLPPGETSSANDMSMFDFFPYSFEVTLMQVK